MKLAILYLAVCCSAFEWPWEDLESSSNSTGSLTISEESSSIYESATASTTSGGSPYVPVQTLCPSGLLVREATSLNDKERKYIEKRVEETNENLISFLSSVAELSDFNATEFINGNKGQHNISIALAYSGGGYRAMLCGAGELLALDGRYEDLKKSGLGGLLQSSLYLGGLSGGSWLVGTLVLNDWITVVEAILPDSGIWDLDSLIFNPSGINVIKTLKYYLSLRTAVNDKEDANFQTSITDVWGRALAYQFFNPDTTYNGGENITWSSITDLESFQNHLMPFPIVLANGRTPGTTIINDNSTIFEITPYELGSWDPSLNSFVDLNYLGTSLDNGKPNGSCYTNYDNAGFILGTLSSLFNQILIRVSSSSSLNWAVKKLLVLILSPFSENDVDIATYQPNPFYNVEYAESELLVSDPVLDLVDGGEDSQNVPLYPFIQSARDVDIIFAYDNSADTNQWPNGTSLVRTYERQFTPQGKGSPFPYVPSVDEFLSDNLYVRPVFFGCDAANLTDLVEYHDYGGNETDIPLVVYIPNLEYLYDANTSTYKMSYSRDEMLDLIQNGFEVSSRGNYSMDRSWPTCVGCAIIRRQQERLGLEQSDECKDCFQDYCWDGGREDSALTLAVSSLTHVSETQTQTSSTQSTSSYQTTASLNLKTSGAWTHSPSLISLLALLLHV